MKNKTIDTLVEDIYGVFLNEHKIKKKNLEQLGENIKRVVSTAIHEAGEQREPTLRMSVIGKPDRQLWYELNTLDKTKAVATSEETIFEPNPEKYFKFLFGHILEQLLIFFILEAGHTVTHDQEELEINGVLGHCDPVIDGVPMDIKTASKYSFSNKFKAGKLLRGDDPFGYIGQLSGYREVLLKKYPEEIDSERAGWLAFNKETGELCLLLADAMDLINAEDRVEHLKGVLSSNLPPTQKCYPDMSEGKFGNRILQASCVFCPFKERCWSSSNNGKGLRKFQYANGVKYFTQINTIPRVPELTDAE